MTKLVDVRCPFNYRSKRDKRMYKCNHLCVRVRVGSSGEAWCNKCQVNFEFEISNQAELKTSIEVKRDDTN